MYTPSLSLVLEAILKAHPKRVICTLLASKNEGVNLAQRLRTRSELIIDGAIGLKIEEVDAIFIGVDGVGSFGEV